MNPTSFIVGALLATTLVACKQSPRYTLHQGTDPRTGQPVTMRLNNETGEVRELTTFKAYTGLWAVWSESMDIGTAWKVDKENRNAATNTGDLIIK